MSALDMKTTRTEIGRHDWADMRCGCMLSADHIPRDFIAMLNGPTQVRAGEGWADSHAYVQSNLMQPAIATASMIMAALADGVPARHHRELMLVLNGLVAGEQDDVADECLRIVQSGSWLLYEQISSGRNIDAAAYAYEILELIDDERERLAFYRVAARDFLPADL
ncbi:hypothetical protein ACFYOD_39130 [Streptomyces sp. NPDC006703]|uniref:hypothetical protein n=1 Tax=Streptomyces sp. NPDC006703 TaxID=3364759 RepID=UPI0036C9FBBD